MNVEYRLMPREIAAVNHLLIFLGENGYQVPDLAAGVYVPLPRINLNYDLPPAFARESATPDLLDIEGLIGIYDASQLLITIFVRGLEYAAERILRVKSPEIDLKKNGLREIKTTVDELQLLVILHEMSHWAMHKLWRDQKVFFDLDSYRVVEESFHELYAQWYTWHALRKANFGDVLATMDNLAQMQSSIYQTHKNFQAPEHINEMFNALEQKKAQMPQEEAG